MNATSLGYAAQVGEYANLGYPFGSTPRQGTIVSVLRPIAAAVCAPGRQLRRVAKLVVPQRCARLLRLRYVLAEARVSPPSPPSEGAPRISSVLKAEKSAGRNTEASPRRLTTLGSFSETSFRVSEKLGYVGKL